MVPGLWLSEGGQSAAGAAIDQLLNFHPAAAQARELAQEAGVPLPVYLADRVLAQVATRPKPPDSPPDCTWCRSSQATARRWRTRMPKR